jgi:hypothetical protein
MLVSYAFRKISQKPQQFLSLVINFSFFIGFVTLNFTIGEFILQDRPIWATKNHQLLTLGKTSSNGSLLPTSLEDIQLLEQVPDVLETHSLAQLSTTIRTDNSDKKQDIQAIFFSPNIQNIISQDIDTFNDKKSTERLVWITNAFKKAYFTEQNIIGSQIYLGEKRFTFTIAGVLPHTMDFIAGKEVSIWLPSSFMSDILPIDIQTPDGISDNNIKELIYQAKKTMLNKIENRFGIAIVKKQFSQQNITEQYKELLSKKGLSPEFSMIGGGLEYKLIAGLKLAPQIKEALQEQWWLLFSLIIFFGVISIINLASYATNQLIERKQEIMIRLNAGARLNQLVKQFIVEALPLIISSITVSLITLLLTYFYIGQHTVVTSLLGTTLPIPSIAVTATSILIITFCILGANLSPLIYSFNNNLFSRQTGYGETKKQQNSRFILSFLQLFIAGTTIYLVLYSISNQWQLKSHKGFNHDLIEYQVNGETNLTLSKTLLTTLKNKIPSEVAFSGSQFVDPISENDITYLSGQDKSTGIRILQIPVSKNYFKVLQAHFEIEGNINNHNVILNQTAFKLLLGDRYSKDINEHTIIFGENKSSSKQIGGVVKNLPHYGQQNLNIPIIYTLLENKALLKGYILVDNSNALDNILFKDFKLKNQGSLKSQILELDKKRIWFITLTLVLLSTLLLSTTYVLFYQIKANIKKQYLRFGILLSAGAPDSKVLIHCINIFTIPFSIAIMSLISIGIIAIIQHWVMFSWSTIVYAAIAILILSLILFSLIFIAFKEVQSMTISDLVRS